MFTISIVSMNDGYVISVSFKEKHYYLETAECKKERKTLETKLNQAKLSNLWGSGKIS